MLSAKQNLMADIFITYSNAQPPELHCATPSPLPSSVSLGLCRYYKSLKFCHFCCSFKYTMVLNVAVHKTHPIWKILSKEEDLTTRFSAFLFSFCTFKSSTCIFQPQKGTRFKIINYYHWTLKCVTDFYRCYYHLTTNFMRDLALQIPLMMDELFLKKDLSLEKRENRVRISSDDEISIIKLMHSPIQFFNLSD